MALPGQGKSGSVRTLVAKKHKDHVFFIAGREKSTLGAALQVAQSQKLNELILDGVLKEICNGLKETH